MQFVRYYKEGGAEWGIRNNDGIYPFPVVSSESPTFVDIANRSYCIDISRKIDRSTARPLSSEEIQLLNPVPQPGQIVCVGLNYHDHAEEQNEEVPGKPLLFAKSPACVTNPGDPIVHPNDVDQVDYEVELAVVIGEYCRNVDATNALDYVAGYTVGNDVSARDAQFDDGQFFRGKSYDTFAPLGPGIVPSHEIDPNNLDVQLRVNDAIRQDSSTSEFIFTVEEVVEYISSVSALRPGDVILTGTPGGVGIFQDPPILLEPGDRIETEIENIGTISNPVVAEEKR